MTEHTLTRTAFDAVQRAIPGSRFAAWHGWEWIAGFGDAAGEHLAVRSSCGLWDQSPRQKWELRGPQALLAIDRFFTNEMRSLQIGQLRYGAFCDDDGRMLGDGIAFRYGEQHYGAVTALPDDGEALLAAAGEAEFELANVTEATPHLQLQGPDSREVLRHLGAAGVETLGYYRFLPEPVEVGGVPVRVARCGYSGELGYELYATPERATDLWNALVGTGRVRPYGLEAVETLRVESGLIALGAEFEPGVTDPFEVNLQRVVRLDKPEFRGRTALIERARRPGRRLVTLLLGDEVPRTGAAVRKLGEAVGEVRSAVAGLTLGRAVALAAVDVAAIAPGVRFQVELGRGWLESECRDEPAYDPARSRVRA